MRTLFLTLVLLSVTSIGGTVTARQVSADDVETQNLITVQASEALCASSGCGKSEYYTTSQCGKFHYEGQRVVYVKSECETIFEINAEQARRLAEDQEIRRKYGSQPDAGTDAGRLDGGLTRELPREDPTEVLS